MPTPSTAGIASRIARWTILLIAAGLIAWNVFWFLNSEPEHDEVEHWHAAWLMHKGFTPFYGFFEHHSPVLWMILRIYYDVYGDNYGIIIVSRLMMVVVLFAIAFVTYRTARYWVSPPAAWIAALGYPLLSVSYFLAHVQVRGDPFIVLLLMGALYFAVPLADKKSWDRVDQEKLFLVFALLGLALAVSPRAGIPVVTFFIMLGIASLGAIPLQRLIGLFFAGGLVVMLPTVIVALPYGLEPYAFWVYKFSASILPIDSPLPGLLKLVKSTFPVVILTVLGFYRAGRQPELRQQRSVWIPVALAVVNFFGLWACRHPFMQHFLMDFPFMGLLAGFGYDDLIGKIQARRKLPAWNYGRAFVFLALILMSVKFYIFWQHRGDTTRSYWVKRAEWIKQYAAKDTYFAAGTAFYSPIFMQDACFFWFGARYVSPTLTAIRKDYTPYSFNFLKERRPAVLHVSFPENWYLTTSPGYQSWLEANYTVGPYKEYYVRKDIEARFNGSAKPEN